MKIHLELEILQMFDLLSTFISADIHNMFTFITINTVLMDKYTQNITMIKVT